MGSDDVCFYQGSGKMYFKEWILRRYGKNGPYADLARFVHDDINFPESNAKVFIIAHLHNMHADEELYPIFEKAWKMFRLAERNRALPYAIPKKKKEK